MSYKFISLLTVVFLILSDPEGGTCGGCSTSLSREGILPDTTIQAGQNWSLNVKTELWSGYASCEGTSGPYVPTITSYQSKEILEVTQVDSILIISAISKGKTKLTLVSGTSDGFEDPSIMTQTLKVTVE